MQFFELELTGFDGSTDATDHLLLWVGASEEHTISVALESHKVHDLVTEVHKLPKGFEKHLKNTPSDLDFQLPEQTKQMVERIKELTDEN